MATEQAILTGFMAMGKSTTGRLAAEVLGVEFYDTDEWMETEMGIDIPRSLDADPVEFRRQEVRALRAILGEKPGIISTGGGFVTTEGGRIALAEVEPPVIWLNGTFEAAAERVAKDTGRERPLFRDVAAARKRYDERQGWYRTTSDHTVNADRPKELVAGEIVQIARSSKSLTPTRQRWFFL